MPLSSQKPKSAALPQGFTYLSEIDPRIHQSPRYAMDDNFLGRPIPSYNTPTIILTEKAAEALSRAQAFVHKDGFDIVVYDAYRPQTAVDAFALWATDLNDLSMKEYYYPRIDKSNVHELGYIAKRSQHSRGSAIDLTLIRSGHHVKDSVPVKRIMTDGTPFTFLDDGTVDMGAHFDLFDEASWHDSPLIEAEHLYWRNYLRHVMVSSGFEPYSKEWWHYALKQEPYPETYFNFPIA